MAIRHTSAESVDISHLISLLEEQIKLVDRLRTLGQNQSQLIDEGPTEALFGLIAQRQQVIGEVDRVNVHLEPFRRQWSRLWDRLDPAVRVRVGPLVQGAQDRLDQIMADDERDCERLKSNQNEIAAELGRVNRSGVARRAYVPDSSHEPSHFTDQQV